MFLIVIPTYNRASLLNRCLISIKRQTFTNYKVLILDDCSSDNTKEISSQFADNNRIIYYRFEVNNGHSDKVFMNAISLGLLEGHEWVICVADDEYFYSQNHLEKVANSISKFHDANLVAVEQGYDYGGIALLDNNKPKLPEYFAYDMLSAQEKMELRRTIRNIFRADFLIKSDFFNVEKQEASDVVFEGEGAYLNIYSQAKMVFVGGVTHIFGVVPSARRKYLDFYTWIVSAGMTAYQAGDENSFYNIVKELYSPNYPIFLNAFFEWGGDGLALLMKAFYHHEDFSKILREIAKICNRVFKENFLESYEAFNLKLPTIESRDSMISSAKNIVLYPENSWREQIEFYLKGLGKNILYVADDYKEGYKRYQDILDDKDRIDCVFITSGHPRIVYQLFEKLNSKSIQVITLILRDDK